MPLMIDGHNLIGKLSGIDLSDPDDEQQLINLLQDYCRRTGRRATVYFDQGDPMSRDPRPQYGVTVHFVSASRSADSAIRDHLISLGRAAKNWTVVSSDRSVRRAASGSGATIQKSEDFAREINAPAAKKTSPEKPALPAPEEVEYWLQLFSKDDPEEAD